MTPAPRASVVMVPRERFSPAVPSLAQLRRNTPEPHHLIYVDAGSPRTERERLAALAERDGFRLLRSEDPLPPNAARNLGLSQVDTEYVAFLDNDVLVEPGWLEALLRCADATDAAVVAPLTLVGPPEDGRVHLAGGGLELSEDAAGRRRLAEAHRFAGERLPDVAPRLRRERCDFAEFHGMLVRRALFDEIGPLDEEVRSAGEHIDLGLLARDFRGGVWFEPGSVLTYVDGGPFTLADAQFFRLRWCEEWNRASFGRLARKWRLEPGSPFFRSNGAFLAAHQQKLGLPVPSRAAAPARLDLRAHGYAQTPAALLEQMRELGCDDAERLRMRRACDRAVRLYAGLFRACGKPFLCHGVGTASILLAHGSPATLAIAGLLHAAYSHGRFRDGGAPGVRRRRRRQLQRRVGLAEEDLVHRYHGFDPSAPAPAGDALEEIDHRDAAVYLMRMANDVEERLDHALAYTGKPADALPGWRPCFREVAARLGVPQLAAQYEAAVSATPPGPVPDELRSRAAESYAVDERTRRRRPFHARPGSRLLRWPWSP